MPVEIAGYVVDEAENPLALDNEEFTPKKYINQNVRKIRHVSHEKNRQNSN
mgnify:CR=1 FL=1